MLQLFCDSTRSWSDLRDQAPSLVAQQLTGCFFILSLVPGGAENLIVNAAVAALERGHEVALYTTHHDPKHCFAETKGDGACTSHTFSSAWTLAHCGAPVLETLDWLVVLICVVSPRHCLVLC